MEKVYFNRKFEYTSSDEDIEVLEGDDDRSDEEWEKKGEKRKRHKKSKAECRLDTQKYKEFRAQLVDLELRSDQLFAAELRKQTQ